MVTENHTVSSYFARAHLDNTVRLGGDEQTILALAGLTRELLREPRTRVSPQQLATIVRANWRVGGDELLGLATHRMKVGVFALLAERLIQCKTLGDALTVAADFYNLVAEGVSFRLVVDNDQARFRVDLANPQLDRNSLLVEYLLLVWHRFPSWLVGQVIPLTEVWFDYAEPDHSEEYRLMFPSHCRYLASYNALVFDAAELNTPVIQTAEDLAAYMSEIPLQWFRKQAFYDTYTAQVIRMLEESASQDETSLEFIAEKLHMTSRTLRRKLTVEGNSYQQLKDNVRRDQAINFLGDPRLTIAQVGRRVGFMEPAAFTRAFKQWTGVSPGIYRKGLHKNP